jgi:hypothetical protein
MGSGRSNTAPYTISFLTKCKVGNLLQFPCSDLSFTKPAHLQKKILSVMEDHINASRFLLRVYSNLPLRQQIYLSQGLEDVSEANIFL